MEVRPDWVVCETGTAAMRQVMIDDRPLAQRAGPGRRSRANVPSSAAEAAVDRLYRTHRLGMVRLAMLLVDDKDTAEDVTQDAFAAVYRRWPALADEHAAVAYLRACVVNGSRSVLRRRWTARRHPQPDAMSLSVEPADGRALLAEEHREVLSAIRRLPTRQREVILLRYWSDLSETETAATLGISIGAVKSNASRGRDAIAAMLEGAK
jgi:RNA polymerase sigma-70 factor (sigma-E family)